MEAVKECIQEIIEKIGEEKVSTDKATRVAHRITHGPEMMMHESLSHFTPAVVVHPVDTEDVVAIVKAASKYKIPITPQGGRSCTYGAEGIKDGIALDTFSMNKILDFDEEGLRITVQAGVRISDYQDFLTERGYMSLEQPTMIKTSAFGSRPALSGYNKWENRWGGTWRYIKGMEVVMANGDVLQLGRGSRVPTKSVVGLDMMSMFIGSRGTLGIITKVTESFIPAPKGYAYGISAFSNLEDGLSAYKELRSPSHSGLIWRTKGYHKWLLSQAVKASMDLDWPDGVDFLVDYHIVGDPELVEIMKGKVEAICEKHNGFWRDDMPPTTFIGKVHESMEKYMGMAAIRSERLKNGGMGYRIVPLDSQISNTNIIPFYKDFLVFLKKTEDGKTFPNLSKNYFVLSPGAPIPGEEGWNKMWSLMLANSKGFDEETRKEFTEWYRQYCELIWLHGGTVTATHGFVGPREKEVEMIKREVGEKEYELMKTIKKTLDPNNIMNPKVKF